MDRHTKRGIMLACDVARVLIIGSVPLAWALGVLTLWQLYVVALTAGVATVFFDVSYQSYLPVLLKPEDLMDGNGKLGATQAFAQFTGPGLGGGLVVRRAVAHVIPAGTLGTAALGFKLFTDEGISGNDAGVMMAAKGIGSTVVLNVLLWLSLVISIALAGFQPIYGTVAIIGTVVLLGVAALVFGVTRGAGRASRVLRVVADKIPGLSGERVEHAILDAARTFATMARDKRVLSLALLWASLNWLLDAASLWAFVAAFGKLVNPIELFAVYGIANVAGALPITPGGLGVVDSITPLLLVGFGVTRSVATLGVIAWRLVNFWLPIPTGALAYLSLKVKPRAGLRAMRSAISGMLPTVEKEDDSPDPPAERRFRLAKVDERQSDVGPQRLAQLRGRLPHHDLQGRPDMAFQQVPAAGGAVGQAEHGVQVRLRPLRLAIAAGPDRDVPDQ